MRLVLALLAAVLLVAAPAPASATPSTEPAPAASATAPSMEMVATSPGQGVTVQASVRAESLAREMEERQIAQRGSFWWLVGVIVIAGVLLAVLLD